MAQRVKESSCNAGDQGSIPESRSSPGEGNGNPIQYSCLENPMDRGACGATVHAISKVLDTTEQLTLLVSERRHFSAVVNKIFLK